VVNVRIRSSVDRGIPILEIRKGGKMSCRGLHQICPCKEELLDDAVDSLAHLLAGLEKYREGLSHYDRGLLSKTIHGIPSAVSVLRRARISK
jgi:hypothetical protein